MVLGQYRLKLAALFLREVDGRIGRSRLFAVLLEARPLHRPDARGVPFGQELLQRAEVVGGGLFALAISVY